MNQAVHNYKDGRRGKFLRTSRRKDEKKFFPQMAYVSTLPANIRFSGS